MVAYFAIYFTMRRAKVSPNGARGHSRWWVVQTTTAGRMTTTQRSGITKLVVLKVVRRRNPGVEKTCLLLAMAACFGKNGDWAMAIQKPHRGGAHILSILRCWFWFGLPLTKKASFSLILVLLKFSVLETKSKSGPMDKGKSNSANMDDGLTTVRFSYADHLF